VTVAQRRARNVHVERLTRAIVLLVRRPRLALGLLTWSGAAVSGRLLAAIALLVTLGVPAPILAAFAMLAALDVAALLPLTPGGIGMTSGAVSVALLSRGIGLPTALAAGIVFHTIETVSSLSFAATFALFLAKPTPLAGRALRLASAAALVAAIGALATTAFLDVA
jgi:uncharacterized membrane protein YbhN (UPF0104 family)